MKKSRWSSPVPVSRVDMKTCEDYFVYMDLSIDGNYSERVVIQLMLSGDWPMVASDMLQQLTQEGSNYAEFYKASAAKVFNYQGLKQDDDADCDCGKQCGYQCKAYVSPAYEDEYKPWFFILFNHMHFLNICVPVRGLVLQGDETLNKIEQQRVVIAHTGLIPKSQLPKPPKRIHEQNNYPTKPAPEGFFLLTATDCKLIPYDELDNYLSKPAPGEKESARRKSKYPYYSESDKAPPRFPNSVIEGDDYGPGSRSNSTSRRTPYGLPPAPPGSGYRN